MDRTAYLNIRRELNFRRKNMNLLGQMVVNLCLGLDIYFLWQDSGFGLWKYLTIPMMVCLIFRSFGLMHESAHGLNAKNKWLNEAIGILSGCVCFLPYRAWKGSHLQHHSWSGNVDKDPVMAFIHIFPKMPLSLQKNYDALWNFWIPILGFQQNLVFWMLALKIHPDQRRFLISILGLTLPIICWGTLVVLAPAQFIFAALAPAVVLYLMAVEIVNLPHHLGLEQHGGNAKFPAWQQYQSSRSCIYPKWFANFFALNFNYHTEHHMFPDAPWYYLEDIQKRIQSELKEEYHTDPYLKWILVNRKQSVLQVIDTKARSRDVLTKKIA
jgi:omega-6 fatty acid desaturase (delta-12 desaturase)